MGKLDSKFRALATRLIGKFSDGTHTLARRTTTYDVATDASSQATASMSVKKSPSFPFDTRQVDGSSVLTTDLRCFVAAADVEAGGIDPTPAEDVLVTLTVSGVAYRVLRATKYESGDQAAAYELHLRAG